MLKPTESPPPSLQPRFAASMTPGPPPVTTANPASANARPAAPARAGARRAPALRDRPPRRPCLFVRRRLLADAGGTEDRDRGTVDLLDELEAGEELRREGRHVGGERLGGSPEDPTREPGLVRHLRLKRPLDVCDRHREA